MRAAAQTLREPNGRPPTDAQTPQFRIIGNLRYYRFSFENSETNFEARRLAKNRNLNKALLPLPARFFRASIFYSALSRHQITCRDFLFFLIRKPSRNARMPHDTNSPPPSSDFQFTLRTAPFVAVIGVAFAQ
jgi:hypothetical protein